MEKERILVVDDDPSVRWTLVEALRGWGYVPLEAETVAGAVAAFDAKSPAVVLLDIELPDGSGLDALPEFKGRDPDAVVIIVTGHVSVEQAVSASRAGAYDFVSKPIHLEELRVRIRNGLEARRLRQEVSQIRRERAGEFSFDRIVGKSPAMLAMTSLARKVAESEVSSVLLQGESGTGKDLLAQAIHFASRRAEGPFVAINCSALPANLVESELFGYEKGAFTDAKARKEGLFEKARGGTLFLDEIGELELGLQAKLLRVIEEGTFRRVGGLKDIPLQARVIAASNRDLRVESIAERFRPDLYYRLSVITVEVPPLRERGRDVLLLAAHFLADFGGRLGANKGGRRLSPEVEAIFCRYAWPGNVRELRNVIERSLILNDGETLTPEFLPREMIEGRPAARVQEFEWAIALPPGGYSLDEVERSLVRQAIEQSDGNQKLAARLLHISRDQLRYRLKKLDDAAHHDQFFPGRRGRRPSQV